MQQTCKKIQPRAYDVLSEDSHMQTFSGWKQEGCIVMQNVATCLGGLCVCLGCIQEGCQWLIQTGHLD